MQAVPRVVVCLFVLMAGLVGLHNALPGAAVEAPPSDVVKEFNLSPFYKKWVSAEGLPVLGSEKVSDEAILEAALIVNQMLAGREDVRRALIENRVRVAVMAKSEKTTDIPEHSDLKPKDYWDRRARGLGATFVRPAISGAVENLLNLKGDRYANESILVHEFAHTFHEMGLNSIDRTFNGKLKAAYKAAMDGGLWKRTYAATNYKEYWAEGVQSYFDCNDHDNRQHNSVDTRDELKDCDPALFKLIDTEFRNSKWRYVRYDKRAAKQEERGEDQNWTESPRAKPCCSEYKLQFGLLFGVPPSGGPLEMLNAEL